MAANAYNQANAVAAAGSRTYSKKSQKAGLNIYDQFGADTAEDARKTQLDAQEASRKKREEAAKSTIQKPAVKQPAQQVPQKNQGNILSNIGDYIAGVNEKVLGGTNRSLVKATNLVTTGFNEKEAERRTNDFLKTTKQVDKNGQAPLAAGKQGDSYETGKSVGDILNMVNPGTAPESVIESSMNLSKQVPIGIAKKNSNSEEGLKKLQEARKWQVKSGIYSQKQADKDIAKYKNDLAASSKSVAAAENKAGVKQAGDLQNALDIVNVAGTAAGLGSVGKTVLTKAAEAATKRLGRDLTEDEAKNLAVRTKSTVPEPEASVIREGEAIPMAPPEPTTVLKEAIPQPAHINADGPVVHPTSLAPLDEPTVAKIGKLKEQASVKPLEEGHTRLFRSGEDGQYVKDPDLLVDASIGADKAEIKFIDVPNAAVKAIDGQPTAFKVDPTAGDTVSGNAARIEAVALEKKLTDTMGDLPQYKSINMKEQATEAVNLIARDKQLALDVIDGKTHPPGNLKAQSVHQALEDLAIKERDGALLTKLAKSNVNTELSESAQNLRIAAERDPHSAVEQIRQIRDARLKRAEKRAKTSVSKYAKDVKKKVDAATPKPSKQDWKSFVEELTC